MAAEFDPRFDPAFQRGYESPTTAPAGLPAATPLPELLRRNPWIWILWVVAVVFTALGMLSQVTATAAPVPASQASPLTEYIVPTVLANLGPWLLGTGLAALVGVLLVSAARWRRA